jgi:hypothetical protein
MCLSDTLTYFAYLLLVIVNGRLPGLHPQSKGCTFERGASRNCIDFCIADARLYPSTHSFEIISHGDLCAHNLLSAGRTLYRRLCVRSLASRQRPRLPSRRALTAVGPPLPRHLRLQRV